MEASSGGNKISTDKDDYPIVYLELWDVEGVEVFNMEGCADRQTSRKYTRPVIGVPI